MRRGREAGGREGGKEEVRLYRIDENEKDDGEGEEVVEEGGEYQLLYGLILITRMMRTISRRSMEVGKMCSNKKCNYHQASLLYYHVLMDSLPFFLGSNGAWQFQ
jgi:hypothetical protein